MDDLINRKCIVILQDGCRSLSPETFEEQTLGEKVFSGVSIGIHNSTAGFSSSHALSEVKSLLNTKQIQARIRSI